MQENREQAAANEKKAVITNTSATSRYKTHVKIALDSFSGYSVLRSQQFADYCGQYGIQIELVDDGADYDKRVAVHSGVECGSTIQSVRTRTFSDG